jgi:hypothetical protein
MLLGPARQEQRRAQRVTVLGGKGDIVDEDVIGVSFGHRDFPSGSEVRTANAWRNRCGLRNSHAGKCEFSFRGKGLSGERVSKL